MKKPLKRVLIGIAIGIPACILLLVGGIYSVFYKGFPPNKKGISSLRTWSNTQLSDREVFQLVQGNMMDSTSIFRFKATQPEIEAFAHGARMHEADHNGKAVSWPPFTRPYWFNPHYAPSNRLYQSPQKNSDLWVLYYETESHTAYFVYFET
jgi:hypothetical protein